ncbi:MAG: protein kinase [Chloroflexi bacterium]|nr:protein kinase [Chloroflexota bacterium]
MARLWEGYRLGGRYEIQELLGEGATSTVYKAFDHNLKRIVAVKIIHPHLANRPDFLRRFEAEARAVAQLRHPNIVQVYDFAHEGELYYMVLEYIPGESLQARLTRLREAGKRMTPLEAVRLLIPLADAVHYAHEQGMIHRDIKPANILLTPQGDPVLTDFGLARLLRGSERHTRTGTILGTVLYMAPEQLRGQNVDHRADIYALSAVLYEMLTGQPPYTGDSIAEVIQGHLMADVPDPRELRPEIPPALSEVVRRGLAKDPEERYASALALKTALEALLPELEARFAAVLERTLVEAPRGAVPSDASAPPEVEAEAPLQTHEVERLLGLLAGQEAALLAGIGLGLAYMWRTAVLLWLAAAGWLLALLVTLRALRPWWRLARAYRLAWVPGARDASASEAPIPLRFRVLRLDYPYDLALMAFPAALSALLTTGSALAWVFGQLLGHPIAAVHIAAVWGLIAIPLFLFHLHFVALNFLQPGVLNRLHFGHFLPTLSLGLLALPGLALAPSLPPGWKEAAQILALGAFGVGGMLGALTLIFLFRRALSIGLPSPSLAPLVFLIVPVVVVYATATLLLFGYLAQTGLVIPQAVFHMTVYTAWGIALAGEVLAWMLYWGYRWAGVPWTPLRWGLVDAFTGPALLALLTWSTGLRGWPVLLTAAGSGLAGVLLFVYIAWGLWRRRRAEIR